MCIVLGNQGPFPDKGPSLSMDQWRDYSFTPGV